MVRHRQRRPSGSTTEEPTRSRLWLETSRGVGTCSSRRRPYVHVSWSTERLRRTSNISIFGDANGCPPGGQDPGPGCVGYWTQDDFGYVPQANRARSLPNIYTEQMIRQWTRIRREWDDDRCGGRRCYDFAGGTSQPVLGAPAVGVHRLVSRGTEKCTSFGNRKVHHSIGGRPGMRESVADRR